ncbi:MAG TPA: dephospho-CoA kinase [Rhizomicrobium sp.]|jgi:dephospho-CoA kinase
MPARRPLVIGLTGSIGMGKTETARMFARLGVLVHDADVAVHRLYEPGGKAVSAVARVFPDCVNHGRVDRTCLAARVRDPKALAQLEAIVHPLVEKAQQAFIAQASRGGAELVVLDVPLLYETGAEARMDVVVVVSAPEDIQRARVLARPGISEAMLDRILERQMPDVDKRARAHFVVETGKGLEHAFAQVESIVKALRARGEGGGDA